MKLSNPRANGPFLVWMLATVLMPLPVSALNINSAPDDVNCAFISGCALSRGGISDGMLVFDNNNQFLGGLIAYGDTEANNVYYFDPAVFVPDPTKADTPTFLAEPDGTYSDVFGVFGFVISGTPVLGFISDPYERFSGTSFPGSIIETIDPNPFFTPDVMEPGSSQSIFYDATAYLAPFIQQAGFKAFFFSDVDPVSEPGTLSLMSLGFACMGWKLRRKAIALRSIAN